MLSCIFSSNLRLGLTFHQPCLSLVIFASSLRDLLQTKVFSLFRFFTGRNDESYKLIQASQNNYNIVIDAVSDDGPQ